jgi:hypothetical protein
MVLVIISSTPSKDISFFFQRGKKKKKEKKVNDNDRISIGRLFDVVVFLYIFFLVDVLFLIFARKSS